MRKIKPKVFFINMYRSIKKVKSSILITAVLVSYSLIILKLSKFLDIEILDSSIKNFYNYLVPFKLICILIISSIIFSIIIKFVFNKFKLKNKFIILSMISYINYINAFIAIYFGMMLSGLIFTILFLEFNNTMFMIGGLSIGLLFFINTTFSIYILKYYI